MNFPTTKDESIHIIKKKVFPAPELKLREKEQNKADLPKNLLASAPEFTVLDHFPHLDQNESPVLTTKSDASKFRAGPQRPDAAKGRAKSRMKEKPVERFPKQYSGSESPV